MSFKNSIAIDGPAGAGKSTAAKLLAKQVGYVYVDTGAMYRALTYKALSIGVRIDDEESIETMAAETKLEIKPSNCGANTRIFCDGYEVTDQIRSPLVSGNVSLIARMASVRRHLQRLQRDIASQMDVVMDGRDVGTRVLPEARFKFFLTASVIIRAERRYKELRGTGEPVSLWAVKKQVIARDLSDSLRFLDPLVRAPTAVLIDSTNLDIGQVVEVMVSHVCT